MITEQEVKEKTIERFWSKIKFGEPNECWEWQAGITKKGYGSFFVSIVNGTARSSAVHRYLYIKLFGELKKGMEVCHSCDNRKCCNPNHLWEGTHLENIQDMDNKGRRGKSDQYGIKNNQAKLTDDHVRLIRMRIAIGETYKSIASAFKISPQAVCQINLRQHWSHVQ